MNTSQPPIIMTDWLRELCGFDFDEYQGVFTADHPSYEYLKKAIADGLEYYQAMQECRQEQEDRHYADLNLRYEGGKCNE